MNTFILVGNVGTDPEEKVYAGKQMKKFSVAENTTRKGEKVTTWYTVYSPAEGLEVEKGSRVMVTGRLMHPGAYVDKAGMPKSQMSVWAYHTQAQPPFQGERKPVEQAVHLQEKKEEFEDDLPF